MRRYFTSKKHKQTLVRRRRNILSTKRNDKRRRGNQSKNLLADPFKRSPLKLTGMLILPSQPDPFNILSNEVISHFSCQLVRHTGHLDSSLFYFYLFSSVHRNAPYGLYEKRRTTIIEIVHLRSIGYALTMHSCTIELRNSASDRSNSKQPSKVVSTHCIPSVFVFSMQQQLSSSIYSLPSACFPFISLLLSHAQQPTVICCSTKTPVSSLSSASDNILWTQLFTYIFSDQHKPDRPCSKVSLYFPLDSSDPNVPLDYVSWTNSDD